MSWKSLISISRVGTRSAISIDTRLSIEKFVFVFDHEMGSDGAAELLSQHLQGLIIREISAIRKKSYEDGYRDGRSKRTRAQHFSGSIGRDV